MTPTAEDYEAWRAHPLTEWMMAGLSQHADRAERLWKEAAWNGQAGADTLVETRTRAEDYRDLAGLSYADALGLHGITTEDEGHDG